MIYIILAVQFKTKINENRNIKKIQQIIILYVCFFITSIKNFVILSEYTTKIYITEH